MDLELLEALRRLVEDLAHRRYVEIVADGRGGILTSEEMRQAIDAYGRQLVPLPDGAVDSIHVYSVDGDPVMRIEIDLWTVEEGESDLTLTIDVTRFSNGYRLAMNDLRVL